ncbi:MAG: isoleucine--tRNA ligase [Candidatus Magasanikbacteria bacterium]|nr:isoleucine--tRNA ligase [Candidatus Magasanikbacteria bacterium]
MYEADKNEKEILKYWDQHKCFEKSVESRPKDKPYVFYDGPPFATGLPHYGHIVGTAMKDTIPRFWTMRGFRVERKWGWDCHGLPIENIVEKALDLKTKKDIEDFGIHNFNDACRSNVSNYVDEWKRIIHRFGRWVDMENSYRTMDINYMESVWWVFRQLWDKNLIYEGRKPMHICPRCETPLSNFEVTQGYKDIKDLTVTAQFKVLNAKEKLGVEEDLYILAWTTTPWTLPGNVLIAVGNDIDYLQIRTINENGEKNKETFLVAKERADYVTKGAYEIVAEFTGSKLVGLNYEPLFPYYKDTKNAFKVVEADFVTTENGTGIVHIAPAFGSDDYSLGEKEEIDFVQHVGMDGKFKPEVLDFVGQEVKPKADHSKTDVEIIKWLAKNGKLFAKEKYLHSYPHCWRCDTPLLNYLTSSWFIRVTELKEDLLLNNEKTNWVPSHIKQGRFGKWLENVRDWAVSRNRFWGAPLPIWRSDDGEDFICVGSVEELEELSGQKVEDLHKDTVDKLVFEKDGKTYHRVSEVLDCWFESGAMPYGQMHYPFENKEKFEAGFPAEFIAEGQDQTRGWFYTLHVLATALTRGENPTIPTDESLPAFRNVIVNGIILAEDGKKMSKRLQNYPDPMLVLEKYGSDALRYYLLSSPVVHAENMSFSEKGVREVYGKVINMLWNVFSFYEMFAEEKAVSKINTVELENVLDKWIVAKLNRLVVDVTKNMEEYKLAEAIRPIQDFIADLSQWYIRRSRDRFKMNSTEGDLEKDKKQAEKTLGYVLLTLSKVMAPFMPFIADKIYLQIKGEGTAESVHLEDWPEVLEGDIDFLPLENMRSTRDIIELGQSARSSAGIKVRQPLSEVCFFGPPIYDDNEEKKKYETLIKNELNVKEVKFLKMGCPDINRVKKDKKYFVIESQRTLVALNTEITEELKKEGLMREIVRTVNQLRKEQGLTREDRVVITYHTEDFLLQSVFEKFAEDIKKGVLADEILQDGGEKSVKIGDVEIELGVRKVD